MSKPLGLALNVFDLDGEWYFTVYPDTDAGVDTSKHLSINPSDEQVVRYLSIANAEDWWTYDNEPDFNFILRGESND
tara:strand:- start:7859 stop:8089 length:231 start_codon:yes stop_codon:yes gene_type:complete